MPLSDYDPIFKSAAEEWNLDPNFLKAIAAQESGGNPKAVSRANAQGLMQIIPETQKYLGVTDPNDPVQSIYGAAKYLSEGLDKEGTPEGALLYYHGGPGWRNAYGPESKAYVPAVSAHYKKFAAQPAVPSPGQHSDMSDSDFLKTTGAGQAAPTTEDDSAFLARTGGKAPAAPTPSPDAGQNEYGITGDPQQFNKPPTTAEQGVSDTINAVGQGAKEGFGSGPLGLSPQSDQALVNAGVFNGPNEYNPLKGINRALIGGGAALGDLALRSGSALVGAYQRGVSQAGESAGVPQLGRDLAALPEAFPTGDTGGGLRLPVGGGDVPPVAVPPRFVSEAFAPAAVPGASKLDRITQLIAHDNAESAGIRAEQNPLAPTPTTPLGWAVDDHLGGGQPAQTGAPPIPQSVGSAASSSNEAALTPKQIQAYRSTAEGQKLLESQPIGVGDRNLYVQGSNPNAAEIEQTVNTARELKSIGMQSPTISQEAREIAAENNDARTLHFAQTAGSPVDLENAKAARSAQAESDLKTAFGSKTPTDAQSVVDTINDILTRPRDSENTAVQQFIRPLLDRLKGPDGALKSDPEQLYGLREDIARMQSKAAKAQTPTLDHVNDQLQDIKDALDGVIEKGAPGYQQYLQNFADASKSIDQMKVLQALEPRLYDAQNRITYNRVQTMMKNIVDARSSPGINPYKSITDDTMQRLWALRDDLRRSASAQELARTPGGSDTAQNLMDVLKGVGKSGADMAVHGALMAHTGPAGNLLYSAAKHTVANKLAARSAGKQSARAMELLHPQTPLQNPLAAP